ncbi:MAG TPA: type ISP restriction/modification enzyme [Bacteroidia bacterium]|nr:type ISP restriction/modification enzyme [Bacteroidia bacterium]
MSDKTIAEYINTVAERYKRGNATEHTYRGDLQKLIEALVKDIRATNEPKRQACGAPDYIITEKDIPIGFIEAKDIGESLDRVEKGEQMHRYRDSLENLVLTDYLEFRLFRNGQKVTTVTLGSVQGNKVVPNKPAFDVFTNLVFEFCTYRGQTITNAEQLAKMMAGKARLLQGVLANALEADESEQSTDTALQQQYEAFKDLLIHDIKPSEFADLYAQTIAYGMFAARLHDTSLNDFTRKEAAELIPKTNPFLRKLFQYIAGYDLDPRLDWIVDALADVFRAADIGAILKNFGRSTQTTDPVIHFYETFLKEYNPALRKSRGVWYTPEPVVDFIVRAVDDILKDEFGLKDGLASTETTEIEVAVPGKKTKGKQQVHKVQILDPAAGTGTFLAQVIKHVHSKFEGQEGIWSQYVEKNLIPRLHGFELLMASYAMCHLKLDMLLTETGYQPQNPRRLSVYLTNSLEEAGESNINLFAQWLSNEAAEANKIKKDVPVMVVLGNPPYLGESKNKGKWILELMEDYKKEPTGGKLQEKNYKWLNDDYVKFIRYGQNYIEKTGEGILAFINPHGFLDNPTFRGMRYNLLKTFDKIYTLDLHGNAKRKETTLDGGHDENVFDIQQGVSINIFVKTGKKRKDELSAVYHYDVYGKRDLKYSFLLNNTLNIIKQNPIDCLLPFFEFKSKNLITGNTDVDGPRLTELFKEFSLGSLTKRDNLSISFSENDLIKQIEKFINKEISTPEACEYFGLPLKDNDKWDAEVARRSIEKGEVKNYIKKITYRIYDTRFIFYHPKFVARINTRIMQHINKSNPALVVGRQGQAVGNDWNVCYVSSLITDNNIFRRGGGTTMPLYIYPETNGQHSLDGKTERKPNFDLKLIDKFAKGLKLKFSAEKTGDKGTFAPIDVLDYIYAVLHSPAYREKYKEFLKIDFPRVPYPTDAGKFWQLVQLGGEIRQLHLLESDAVDKFITTYPVSGSNEVEKPWFDNGKVWINETQYFDKVPKIAWEFYIGGYQPAQKWLKDRKGRTLEFDDIRHYQQMIVALTETARLMQEIDKVGVVE